MIPGLGRGLKKRRKTVTPNRTFKVVCLEQYTKLFSIENLVFMFELRKCSKHQLITRRNVIVFVKFLRSKLQKRNEVHKFRLNPKVSCAYAHVHVHMHKILCICTKLCAYARAYAQSSVHMHVRMHRILCICTCICTEFCAYAQKFCAYARN